MKEMAVTTLESAMLLLWAEKNEFSGFTLRSQKSQLAFYGCYH